MATPVPLSGAPFLDATGGAEIGVENRRQPSSRRQSGAGAREMVIVSIKQEIVQEEPAMSPAGAHGFGG
jgi:hypothetical protein